MHGFGKSPRFLARVIVTLTALLAVAFTGLAQSGLAAELAAPPYGQKTLIWVSDGMRPDLVERWSRSGDMPNYAKFFSSGVTGENGMVPAFPPNTGTGWATIATGALPSVSGSVNNTFHIVSNAIVTSTSAYNASLVQAETLGEVAEKYGKKVAVMEWPGALPNSKLKGPVVDFRNTYSGRGVIANYDVPGVLPNFVRDFRLNYVNNAQVADATGWSGAPQSFSPAKEMSFSFDTNAIDGQTATLTWNVYIYDSTNDNAVNYDMALVSRDGKSGAQPAASMKAGDWADIKLMLPQNNLRVGFYLKLIDLSPDLSKVRFFYTQLSRARSNMPELEEMIARDYPTATAADFAPIEAGIVDDATYVEQGLKWYDMFKRVHEHIVRTYNPDLVMAGYPATDEFSHLYFAKATPGTPVYNATDGPRYEGYIKQAYMQSDAVLGDLMGLLGANTVAIVGADHGFAATWKSVNAAQVLQNAGLYDPANRATSQVGAYQAGGTLNVYVNQKDRQRGGVVESANYEAVRQQIMDAFNNLTDNGEKVVAAVWKKEQLFDLQADGYNLNSWHPTRTGDVVVVLRPPYQFDAPTAGQVIADAPFYGQHGFLPDLVDLERGVNMHGMFGIMGPGVAKGKRLKNPRAIDVAPTAAFAMNIPGPRHAQGRVLSEAFDEDGDLVPVQVLSWSDYHCQLDPVTDRSDSVNVNSGGVALIAEYWKRARAENPNGTIILGSGDEVGATPPNCAFLGDRPAIDAMNMIGFNAAAIGNHEFDKGIAGLRALQAQARFTYLANNIIDERTGRLADFATPYIVVKANGIDVGIIGVGNPQTPSVVNPRGIEGLRWADPVEATNRNVRELVARGVRTIVVIYHQGSTSTDMDKPTGPLADLAMSLDPEVDLLTGGHNRRPTMARVNGILVNEGNQALLTNRFHLLVDPQTKNVVYSWGVFQRPWGGPGVTGDPQLAALARAANEQIKPILETQVGTSAELIDRSRGAESKMGNLVSDAIRATYQTDVALQNSGGLRADIDAGPISRAEVFAVLPFGNLVVVGDLSGADLLAALENGVSDVSGTAGRFIQLSGVRFAYDPAKPVGQRVLWAVLSDGRAVEAGQTYRVATNDFMYFGGDNYTSLTRLRNVVTQAQLYEVAAAYIASLGTINPQVEGRIVAAQAGQPAPAPATQATPAMPTPQPLATLPAGAGGTGAQPTATAAPGMVVATPTAVAGGTVPGMPRTGGGGEAFWIELAVIAALFIAAGVWMNLRRRAKSQA